MDIYPKEDIKNGLGSILWHKNKKYECSEYPRTQQPQGSKHTLNGHPHQKSDYYIVTCELIANEYPIMTWEEIKTNNNIDIILK